MFGITLLRDKDYRRLNEELTIAQRTLDDIGWININAVSSALDQVYIAGGFKKMLQRSKIFYYNNPLAGNWINLTTQFVFGEGISDPKSNEKSIQDVLDGFWQDPDNQSVLTTFQAYQLLSNKLQYEGNLFFMLFDDEEGDVRVRILNTEDVNDIIFHKDDRNRPLFYKVTMEQRNYNFSTDNFDISVPKTAYYADISVADAERYGVPKNKLVTDVRIFHVKINSDVNDKFGIPDLYRGLDWMNAHKDMSGDLATFIKSISQLAWKMKVKGSAAKVSSIKDALSSKTSLSNIMNTVGRTQIENEGVDLDGIKTPTGGVQNMTSGLEKMALMVCAASGIPYHYYGDPSSGNLATAKTMELPLIRKFVAYQKLWSSIYNTILRYQIARKMSLGLIDGGVIINPKTNREEINTALGDLTIDIDFPPVIEEDLKAYAEAMQTAKNARLVGQRLAAQLFMTAANVNNVKQELDEMEKDGGFDVPDPVVPPPFGSVDPKANQAHPAKEATEPKVLPDRLTRKMNFTEQRMNGYRKALYGHYKKMVKEIREGIRTDKTSGVVTGTVRDLDGIVKRFTSGMKESSRKFFPVAVDIGEKFIRSELLDRKYSLREDNGRAKKTLDSALQWNDHYLDTSLSIAITDKVSKAMRSPYEEEEEFASAVIGAAESFDSRVELYVGAFWTVEEMAVKEAGSGVGAMVNFVGPEDDDNCPGCERAVAGNPWLMDEAPIPGMQECVGRCRHALQVIDTVI